MSNKYSEKECERLVKQLSYVGGDTTKLCDQLAAAREIIEEQRDALAIVDDDYEGEGTYGKYVQAIIDHALRITEESSDE